MHVFLNACVFVGLHASMHMKCYIIIKLTYNNMNYITNIMKVGHAGILSK